MSFATCREQFFSTFTFTLQSKIRDLCIVVLLFSVTMNICDTASIKAVLLYYQRAF